MTSKQFMMNGISRANTVMPLTNSNARSVLSTTKQMRLSKTAPTINNFAPWSKSNRSISQYKDRQTGALVNAPVPLNAMTRSYGWKPNLPRGYKNRSSGGCSSCGGAR